MAPPLPVSHSVMGEAITVMDQLMQTYGYTSDGESFSIADPTEVWIMEVIGKGPQHKGTVWVRPQHPPLPLASPWPPPGLPVPLV